MPAASLYVSNAFSNSFRNLGGLEKNMIEIRNMALELREGALARARGVVKYQPEFNEAGC